MASIESVRASIDANVKTNGQQKITGSVLNSVLNDMVDLSEQTEGKVTEQGGVLSGLVPNVETQGETLTEQGKQIATLSKGLTEQGKNIENLDKAKADQDGKYPELTAGFATNLVGRGEAVDATINFRPSGGMSIEDGAARVKELKGNSVVWNNKIYHHIETETFNGVTLAYNGNGTYKMTGQTTSRANFTITPDVYATGHKFLVVGGKSATTYAILVYYDSNRNYINTSATEKGNGLICDIPNNVTYITLEIVAADNAGVSVDYTITPLLVDLTQMFGVGNEPTSVEEFYAMIPQNVDLYAYNEGEIVSTNAEGIKSVGFNAWDEVWEQGSINPSYGTNYDLDGYIRSKNYIPVIGGQTYYFKVNTYTYVYFWDENNEFLGIDTRFALNESTYITLPMSARYMRFTTGESTYNHDICINLSHSGYRNGEYQPYVQFIRDVDSRIKEAFPNGMKSAGNASDKVYNKNGKGYVEKRIGAVDLGSLEWYADSGRFNSSAIADIGGDIAYRYLNVLCRYTETMSGADKTFFVYENKQVFLYDSAYTDAVSLKAALKGVPLFYELAEPIITEYDEPFNLDYEVWDFGTEQMLSTKPSAPIKASIVYGFNAVDSVRTAQLEIAELKTQIAQMQAIMASMTAQTAMIDMPTYNI